MLPLATCVKETSIPVEISNNDTSNVQKIVQILSLPPPPNLLVVGPNPTPGASPSSAASRYSSGRVQSVVRIPRMGMPIAANISTAHMERWNLTLRMQNRRFTRLTNAFSKKFENHRHMIALAVVFYNFCKSHKSLGGKTPAMAAGLTDYVWTARDLLALDPMWMKAAA